MLPIKRRVVCRHFNLHENIASTPEDLPDEICLINSNFARDVFIFELHLASTLLVATSLPDPSGHLLQGLVSFCSDRLLAESLLVLLFDSLRQAAREVSYLTLP